MSSWVHALESPPGSPGWGDELALALEAMRGALGTPPCRLYVTLLPPLVEVKRIELPPMRENELRRILSRDAERYFLQSREPLVVGIQPIGRSRRSPAPLLAIAAATAVVERVFEAAERNHCPLLMLGAAHFAWAVGPSGTRRSGSSASGLVEVRLGDVTEGLVLERGHLVLVRHARHSGALPLAGPAERAEPVDRILEPDLVAAR